WRMTAQRLLLERQDQKSLSLLKKLCSKGKSPEARVHAIRILAGLNALSDQEIELALKDPAAGVREHGLQLAEPRLTRSPALSSRTLALADDPDARVRFQCALSLGELNEERTIPALAKIAMGGLDDKWTRAAALTAITHRERLFLKEMLSGI